MTDGLIQTVRALLAQEPNVALCDSCLAFACSTSLLELRAVSHALLREGGRYERASTCASCRRTVATILYRAASKCAHCSGPIDVAATALLIEHQPFHVPCLRRLITDETVRVSRALNRRSRDLIAQSRRRLRERGPSCGGSAA